MYKFTNGVVVFTEEDKERFVKAGYILEKEKVENDKDDNTNGTISREHEQSVKAPKRFRR